MIVVFGGNPVGRAGARRDAHLVHAAGEITAPPNRRYAADLEFRGGHIRRIGRRAGAGIAGQLDHVAAGDRRPIKKQLRADAASIDAHQVMPLVVFGVAPEDPDILEFQVQPAARIIKEQADSGPVTAVVAVAEDGARRGDAGRRLEPGLQRDGRRANRVSRNRVAVEVAVGVGVQAPAAAELAASGAKRATRLRRAVDRQVVAGAAGVLHVP